jgi:hypothetical protein
MKLISDELYDALDLLGIIPNEVRKNNVGASDYAEHLLQPWTIIQAYKLNYWDGDIVKRVLRKKATDARRLDYEKIKHICDERIRQIDAELQQNKKTMTRTELIELIGKDNVLKLESETAEATSRVIYPTFEAESAAMMEYRASLTLDNGTAYAYYYQPVVLLESEDDSSDYGSLDWDVARYEFEEK